MTNSQRRRGRPPGPPLDRDARREELLDAAETTIAELGATASLAQVAANAGLTRSAVYAAFADRDELIEALTARHGERIVDRLLTIGAATGDPYTQVRDAVEMLIDWSAENPPLAGLLLSRFPIGDRPGSVSTALTAVLDAGFVARKLDNSPALTWSHALIGAIAATARWWSATHAVDRGTVVDHLTQLVWGGFHGLIDDAPIVDVVTVSVPWSERTVEIGPPGTD